MKTQTRSSELNVNSLRIKNPAVPDIRDGGEELRLQGTPSQARWSSFAKLVLRNIGLVQAAAVRRGADRTVELGL